MRRLPIRTALVSVFDKTGVVELGQALTGHGVRILSTGGTARALSEAGVTIDTVESVTGQAEIFAGRVKTLHPKIHAALLARRDVPEDLELLKQDGIEPIDLVVVNLYPFEQTIEAHPDDLAAAIEKIDIGGPTMIRSAAKNHRDVVVIADPSDYEALIKELEAGNGTVSESFAAAMAVKAFQATSSYDAAIQLHFQQAYGTEKLPPRYSVGGPRIQPLRYGENPHQQAAFYGYGRKWGLTALTVHQGKELSYNNLLDLDGAMRAILEFGVERPAAVVVKHTNPCGVALGDSLVDAYRRARDVDPVSAFGGIIALNRPLDLATAEEIASTFVECIICPAVEPAAAERLAKKKNVRVATVDPWPEGMREQLEVRSVAGGLLIQEADRETADEAEWKVVSRREPTDRERDALRFAWKVVRHVKSNAIVFTSDTQALGIGAGQMSRVDASRIAVIKAGQAGHDLNGSVLASDAFFPFRDGVDAAAEAGATAIIQPGGSIRDEEVIAAADEHGMAMIFTGRRHFKH
ncbi:MAG: bifunctional phosphoribosylaminoimidazolecarboxamide formyltransferase/IMP cyclohydrolase PurH [Candidatus Dadabacteria bacterium]|nr:MAG: bifunctional phosphoribosylaminoimidazolecarboxamide formyltransferase/IMP cyclohydrolase PurH [Candidatus Dadabacteria bacterium]